MWTLITQLAQNQITTQQSILFLMLLIGFEVARRAVSTKLTWQARRRILSRYRGAEVSPHSSTTDEETPSRETLETFFQHKLTETTLPSWRRGVIDTILPREIRRDWSLWIVVGVISLFYGVMILSSWSLVSQSENAFSLQVLKLVSVTFGSTLVGAIEMLSLYRWLCTYSFTVSQQPLSTFGIWKQVQQKGTERLIPQVLACLPVMAVLVWATRDFTIVTLWLLAVLVVLIGLRTMLVGVLIVGPYEKLVSGAKPLMIFPVLFACLMLTLFPAMFVVTTETSNFWLLSSIAANFCWLLAVELFRRYAEREPA